MGLSALPSVHFGEMMWYRIASSLLSKHVVEGDQQDTTYTISFGQVGLETGLNH